MIADKIIPSFYIVEVEGDAIESIIPGDFGIEKISFGSHDFDTDLIATSVLQNVLQFITTGDHLDLTDATEKIDFNPEFFPSLGKLELTDKQKEDKQKADDLLEEMEATLDDKNQTAIVMSRLFDTMGDFVESRWEIESPDFKVIGRVAVNPDTYIQEKAKQRFAETRELLPNIKPTVFH